MIDALNEWLEEIERLKARVEKARDILRRVRLTHPNDGSSTFGPWCPTCQVPWPCHTVRILDGET